MQSPLFEIRGLTKFYQGKRILDISSLSIEKGRIYGLVGPNGAGKTTLLRILAALEPPTSGEVFYKGQRSEENPAGVRREVTMVMQNPLLFRTTVYKNVVYGLQTRGVRGEELRLRAAQVLSMVGLSDLESRERDGLSAGEIRRVALARALVLDPGALLLDEPTANLDVPTSESIESIIKTVNQERDVTVVSATPDPERAYRLTDQVIPLLEGKVAPNPIDNLFSGELVQSGGEKWLSLGEKMRIAVITEKAGPVRVSVDPKEILLSLEPFTSSARNRFVGRVVRAADEDSSVRLWIDAGVSFVVVVTKSSFKELGLNLGAEVYLTFKASSVHVY